ncbi:hypothetical protein [Actinomyces slackii]|nr:hypothetical protein [Actinomyces slackii]
MSAATSSLEEPPPSWHRTGDLDSEHRLGLGQVLMIVVRELLGRRRR